jgi:hypothetical protein
MFEVVQDEQHSHRRNVQGQLFSAGRLAAVGYPEYGADYGRDQRRIGHGRQVNECRAIRKQLGRRLRDVNCEPCLADSTRADQRHETHFRSIDQIENRCGFPRSADEGCDRLRRPPKTGILLERDKAGHGRILHGNTPNSLPGRLPEK